MAKITLINRTDEMVRLALFIAPVLNPNLAAIAWKIVSPPPGGSTTVNIPPDFAVQARYAGDPSRPSELDTTTATVAFAETTAAFSIDSITSEDRQATGAVIHQIFTDLVVNEVRIANRFPIGVEVSILKGGDPIYPPQVVWPGGILMEDVRGSISVAVVSQFATRGQRLVQEEISLSRTEVIDGGTLQVTGSQWTGYALMAL
ncbi:hypothetical protein [Lysobacter hankyongensis]|uniref:Phage tail protein n=1 Tax=Lysobacter hankyongensis TaxID=1176535 RepID=A0ABP9C171_9GAMM